MTITQRDEDGNVVETTIIITMSDGSESVVVKDANGNVTDAYVQNGPAETVVSAQRGGGDAGGGGDADAAAGDPSGDKAADGEGGDDAQANASPTPPPSDEGGDEPSEPTDSDETKTAENSTPNPEAADHGTGFELSEKTGGRLGGQEARNARRGLDLAVSGGGAAGPENPESTTSSGVLLTPEEVQNFERLLGIKAGGGVTDPSPMDKDGFAVTERDLRELGLRGNGGAKGPTENGGNTPPPQDPASPIGGPAPGPVPQTARGVQGSGIDSSALQDSTSRLKNKVQESAPNR